jgi:thymidylate synthase (FAD)
MILVEPSVETMYWNLDALKLIELAGRTCYKSEDKMTPDSAEKFVRAIINNGHESVIEHSSVTVRFVVDRGVSHEIVRHRIASYSQESTRYCDYNRGQVTFVIPPWCKHLVPCEVNDISDPNLPSEQFAPTDRSWGLAMLYAEGAYRNLRSAGWKPEQARSVLPNSLKTELVMTANIREWRHFFRMRTSPKAHPQMREVSIPLLKEMQGKIPVVFNDIPLVEEPKQ